jgi:toxin YoeB
LVGERLAVFHARCREDLRWWAVTDRKLALRLYDLIEAVMPEPFAGIGKPEPLKGTGANLWSRRINDEHRLVYVVKADRIAFLQARYHYQK